MGEEEEDDEESCLLRGWQPGAWYEILRCCLCSRWLLPEAWLLRLAATRCPLARAALVSVHNDAGRCLAVRRVAHDGSFRHRGVRFSWNGATFREERGLDDGQLTCGQLLASAGVRTYRRPSLLLRYGLNEYRFTERDSGIPRTRWLVIGAFLWLLRSHYLTAGVAAIVAAALWLLKSCRNFAARIKFHSVLHPPASLALPAAGEIQSSMLVPGDVVALKQADRAPCDLVLLSGDCVVDQGEVALPRMAAKWPLRQPEGELFCAYKHRASVILRPSRIVCSRGEIRAVVLRTGAATESVMLLSRDDAQQQQEELGPAQWAVAAVTFLLSLLFWLGRDRFTWDEVLLRALSVHLLLFPPRALLTNWLLEEIAASALASAGAKSARGALVSVSHWGRATSVAIDCTGALCQSKEMLAGVLPSGCHGFAPVVSRGLAQLLRGHPLRWAAAAVGAALWHDGIEAFGHPHEVAMFAGAGSGHCKEGDGSDYALDTPPEPPGTELRLASYVNPFWSTQRLDQDLRETRDPSDIVSSCVVRTVGSCEPPWVTNGEGGKGDEAPAPTPTFSDTPSSETPSVEEHVPLADVPQVRVQAPNSHVSPCPVLLAGFRAVRRLSGRMASSCPMCPKQRVSQTPMPSECQTPCFLAESAMLHEETVYETEEQQAQPEDLLHERGECRRLRVLECQPRCPDRDRTTVHFRTRNLAEIVHIGRPADIFPLCRGAHMAPPNAEAVAASFHERGFGVTAVAGRCCLEGVADCGENAKENHVSFEGLFFFEPMVNPSAAKAVEELRRIGVRPVVVDEANVFRCIAVARATGVVLTDEPVLLVAARKTVFGGPALDVRTLETPSLFELQTPKQKEEGGQRVERLHYALSYATLVVLRKQFPGLLASMRDCVSVVGGLPAHRATSVLRLLDIQTVCAGGATLGLAAKRKHGGSIVVDGAPWASLACGSVADVPRVAATARQVLGSRGLTLDYVAISVCLQACALLVLYAQRATFTDRMYVYLEAVACGGPTLALAVSGRSQDQTPPPRQDTAAFVLHGLCWLATQVGILGQLHCRAWYARLSERLQRRLDASVLFLLASYQLPLLGLQLATFRGGTRLRPVVVACAVPLAVTTFLMLPWATSASLALGLPRWPRDRDTALLRVAIALAALLNLLADCLAQLFVAPKFGTDGVDVAETFTAETRRIPVAESHIGRMPGPTATRDTSRGINLP